jgi:hypothetical protein
MLWSSGGVVAIITYKLTYTDSSLAFRLITRREQFWHGRLRLRSHRAFAFAFRVRSIEPGEIRSDAKVNLEEINMAFPGCDHLLPSVPARRTAPCHRKTRLEGSYYGPGASLWEALIVSRHLIPNGAVPQLVQARFHFPM